METTSHLSKRIHKELSEVAEERDSESVICLECKDASDLLEMRGIIIASSGSPIEGYILFIDIKVPEQYPFKPPKIRFQNKLWHPRVNERGGISMDSLSTEWHPRYTTGIALSSLQAMLTNIEEDCLYPDEHWLNRDAIRQYRFDRALYNKTALEYTVQDNEGYGRLMFSDYRLRALQSILHMEQTLYKLYVFAQNKNPCSWTLSLVLVPNFYTYRDPTELRYRHYVKLTTCHFRLNCADSISIDFGNGSTRDQCWKIMPISEMIICTEVIRSADPRQPEYEPSAFKLNLEWIRKDAAPQRFLHKFHILNDKDQTTLHSFDVCLDPTPPSATASVAGPLPIATDTSTKYYERPSMVELTKFKSTNPKHSGSAPFDLTSVIGPNFIRFGTILLDDTDGNKMASLRVEMVGRNPSDIVFEILRRWLGGEGQQPTTWSTIVEVLYDVKLSKYAGIIEETKNSFSITAEKEAIPAEKVSQKKREAQFQQEVKLIAENELKPKQEEEALSGTGESDHDHSKIHKLTNKQNEDQHHAEILQEERDESEGRCVLL